ncbi:uncharacterized protein [Anoplolepis gracilipes]|uniref:uncharacterized protein n=1 Tax=Anoplolepis gracilipes TaxID=354296 RepID=UPI003BA262D2
MPRLLTYSAIWILMLLFDLTVTENKLYPKRNISLFDLQKEIVARDSFKKFWKRRLLHKNEVLETVGSLMNETSRLVNNQIAKDTNLNGEFENVMENTKERTLIDYNDPAIIGEDLDNKNNQNFTDHVRVKRNGLTNDSIIDHQLNHTVNLFDSFPQRFWSNTDAINVYGDSTSDFKDYVNSDHRNRSSILDATILHIPYSQHKKGVLSKNRQYGKRMKRNIRHSKYRVGIENRKKKNDKLKSSRKSTMKKANNSKKTSKKTKIVPVKTMSKSRIEKRQSRNDSLKTDLLRTSITDYDKREEDAVALPFMHTGRAELRVRIEKIPRNESFLNNWTDYSIKTTTCSPALSKYDDEIVDANTTEFQFISNIDSTERQKVNNLTVEIIVKKLNYGNGPSNRRTNDFGNASFCNTESHPIESDLSRIKDDRDLESDNRARISGQLSDENAKSRAKRNQKITSRRLRSDWNAMIGSKRFKNGQETLIEDAKHEKMKHKSRDNRTLMSIKEIKELAEKLIVKVNELQMYVSDCNETRHTTDIYVDKNANRVVIEETPRISSEKKHVAKVSANCKSDIANDHRHFTRNSGRMILREKGISSSRMPFSGTRFARGDNPNQKIKSRRKWGRWMDWSSCSVTCGKGRQIRWRHCLRDCNDAETEMEEKACQLPACPPGKFLGIF